MYLCTTCLHIARNWGRNLFVGLPLAAALLLGAGCVAPPPASTDAVAVEEPAAEESTDEEASAPAEQPAFTVSHYALNYTPGPNWVEGKPLLEQDLTHHTEYMQGLFADGLLTLGGPIAGEDQGLYIVAATSADELQALLDGDPGLIDGVFEVAASPWVVLFDQPADSTTGAEAAESADQPSFAVSHYALSYTPGPNWAEGKSLLEQDLTHHTEYMQGVFADGSLTLGGPIAGEDRGFYIMAAASEDELQSILDGDPGLVDGLFEVAASPWVVLFDQDMVQ